MSSGRIEDVKVTEVGVSGTNSKNSRGGSIFDIPPKRKKLISDARFFQNILPCLTISDNSTSTIEVNVVTFDRDVSITTLEALVKDRQDNLTIEVDSDTLQTFNLKHALHVVSVTFRE